MYSHWPGKPSDCRNQQIPRKRCLHVLTVAGKFQCLQPEATVSTEAEQVSQLHEFWGDERQDNVHYSIAKVDSPSQPGQQEKFDLNLSFLLVRRSLFTM